MQTHNLLVLSLSASLLVSACQPKAEVVDTPIVQATESKVKLTPIKANKTVAKDNTIGAKDCLALNNAMLKVDGDSEIEAIYTIQKQLKACLLTANNAEVLTLLANYQAMYKRFLTSSAYENDEQLYEVMSTLDSGKKVPSEQLATLTPRLRYLAELVESDADISVLYLGEGYYEFHHNLKAMADIFTPYLRKDQSEFIQRLAQDNQDIFWNDAGIAISFKEVIERASFWENYLNQYPNGYFIEDAKRLFAIYRHALFLGSENTQWVDGDIRKFYDANDAKAIRALAKRSDSILAQDARHLLKFMTISDDERQQTYPVAQLDEDSDEMQAWEKGRSQLTEALSIPLPLQEDTNRDCMSSIVCEDYNVE